MPTYAYRATDQGRQLINESDDLSQSLGIRKAAILVIVSQPKWHPTIDLMRALNALRDSIDDIYIASQLDTNKPLVDDFLWLESRSLIDIARYKDEKGNYFKEKPRTPISKAERNALAQELNPYAPHFVNTTELGHDSAAALTRKQQAILQVASSPTRITELFKQVRRLRDTALLDEDLAATLADLHSRGYVKVYQ